MSQEQTMSPQLGCCRDLQFRIGGEHFIIDCYELALGSYHMVLGVQWLKSLGSILWYFDKQMLMIIHDSHRMLWPTAQSPEHVTLLSTEADLMEDLLCEFIALFQKPTGLPPPHGCAYHIWFSKGPPGGSLAISLCLHPEGRVRESVRCDDVEWCHLPKLLNVLCSSTPRQEGDGSW
jgi:hypothetical protein